MASFDFITHVLEVSCQAIPYSFVSARQLLHGEQSLELSKPPYTHNMYAAYYTQCIVFAHRCMLGFFFSIRFCPLDYCCSCCTGPFGELCHSPNTSAWTKHTQILSSTAGRDMVLCPAGESRRNIDWLTWGFVDFLNLNKVFIWQLAQPVRKLGRTRLALRPFWFLARDGKQETSRRNIIEAHQTKNKVLWHSWTGYSLPEDNN